MSFVLSRTSLSEGGGGRGIRQQTGATALRTVFKKSAQQAFRGNSFRLCPWLSLGGGGGDLKMVSEFLVSKHYITLWRVAVIF
jgi:hypothetical protein